MEVCRRSSWLLLLLGVSFLATTLQGVQGEAESEGPSESECRPYIEKALKELETGDTTGTHKNPDSDNSEEDVPTIEITTDDSDHQTNDDDDGDDETREESVEQTEQDDEEKTSNEQDNTREETDAKSEDANGIENGASQEEATSIKEESAEKIDNQSEEEATKSNEQNSNENDNQQSEENLENAQADAEQSQEENDKQSQNDAVESQEETEAQKTVEQQNDTQESQETSDETNNDTDENTTTEQTDSKEKLLNDESVSLNLKDAELLEESAENVKQSNEEESAENLKQSNEEESAETEKEAEKESAEEKPQSVEEPEQEQSIETDQDKTTEVEENTQEESTENITKETLIEKETAEVIEQTPDTTEDDSKSDEQVQESKEDGKSEETDKSNETDDDKSEAKRSVGDKSASEEQDDNSTETKTSQEVDQRSTQQDSTLADEAEASESAENETKEDESNENTVSAEDDNSAPEEELSLDFDIPTDLRNTDHVEHLLKLDAEASETETIINRVAEITLRDLKKLYENAIKPLEVLYKYRDLSNRHFGDSEIFSKPLILFMGPWSGGKSSIINYLLDNEYNETSLKTGAEPSPAYFNLLLHGDEYEVIDGTQLAADFTFSGLQKFGQGLEERLRGVKLPHKLLEKVNIVEIPGILEVRKQVSRVFPFNDACQWFIDRADIIFLVYDPSKLDVGPETEAILDQLKGREHQSRIILNKADQVKPEELMRVQGALIWNISPLMSSPQPPIMYTTSLWSRPYEPWAPTRLLQAQERAFLRDLRSAVDKRIENKIASARRFAVRVRNHAKMVDCYLTTYYNHKSVFGNRKQVADEIIDHPQDYHIYEGLSTLTNISRYDLPDPDVYRDFFKLNPLYEFQQLSATCTYFRGCPINRLDIAIAYDLPELIGKHKRLVESALAEAHKAPVPGS